MGDIQISIRFQINSFTIHFSVRNKAKKIKSSNDAKIIYPYLFCYGELKRLNEIDVNFCQLVSQT